MTNVIVELTDGRKHAYDGVISIECERSLSQNTITIKWYGVQSTGIHKQTWLMSEVKSIHYDRLMMGDM